MNERIKQLEKQCWSHRVDGVLVDGHLHFDTKKFAELIVEECRTVVVTVYRKTPLDLCGPLLTVDEEILEHFYGVRE